MIISRDILLIMKYICLYELIISNVSQICLICLICLACVHLMKRHNNSFRFTKCYDFGFGFDFDFGYVI
jgi:hypothetical protein